MTLMIPMVAGDGAGDVFVDDGANDDDVCVDYGDDCIYGECCDYDDEGGPDDCDGDGGYGVAGNDDGCDNVDCACDDEVDGYHDDGRYYGRVDDDDGG